MSFEHMSVALGMPIKNLDKIRMICFYAFMRTTIDLPDPLFKKVKAAAALQGVRLREFIASSLEHTLSGKFSKGPRRVKLPLIKGDGSHSINPTREELDASLWD